MLTLLAAALALQQGPSMIQQVTLPEPDGEPSRLMMQVRVNELESPKLSPKRFAPGNQRWTFPWMIGGYARTSPDSEQFALRFRVFSQEREEGRDPARAVQRMLLRLWTFNYDRLLLEHSPAYNRGIVDFYLCIGGRAGGEQLFDVDDEGGIPRKVNTVYLYSLETFTDPVEMAREVAHEYGHATLPAVGGFETPEDWGNGYLGEKLYLLWLQRGMASGRFRPEDAMGATEAQLRAWVKRNVEPLVTATAVEGPNAAALAGKGQRAMDAYLGLALYAAEVLPERVFARSMRLIGSTSAKDYPNGIVLAAEEPERYQLTIPEYLKGRAIWIPLGKGRIDGAKVLKRNGAWAQISPGAGPVTVTPVLSNP
jgi:hypothetical protein